jgi:hypothetical protein
MGATLPRRYLKLLARVRARGTADVLALASVAVASMAAGATIAFAWIA